MKQEDRIRLEAQNGSSSSNNRARNMLKEDIYVPNRQLDSRDLSSPALRVLLEMGFRRDDAITALHRSRGDIMQAVDWILIHGSTSHSVQVSSPPVSNEQKQIHTTRPIVDTLIDQEDWETNEVHNNNRDSKQNDAEEDDNFANFEEFEEFVSAEQLPNSSQEQNHQHEEIRNKILNLYNQIQVQPTDNASKDSFDYLFQDNDSVKNATPINSQRNAQVETTSVPSSSKYTTNLDQQPKTEDNAGHSDPFQDLLSLSSVARPHKESNTVNPPKTSDDGVFQGFDT